MTQPKLKHVLATGFRLSLPSWVLMAYFAATGSLTAGAALAGGSVVLAATCALAWKPLARLLLLQRRLERLQQPGSQTNPDANGLAAAYAPFKSASALSDLAGEIQRLEQAWGRERQTLMEGLKSAALLFDALPDPLVTLDRHGRIVYANTSARDLLAAGDNDELAGRDLSALLRQPDVLDAAAEALAGASPKTVEFTRADKVEQILEARVEPIAGEDAGGNDARALLVLRDVTNLRRSERMRADFVANVSHELRTPLSSLIGFIETLRGPARDDAEAQERFLGIMQTQAARMSGLVADLLSLSRIEMNEYILPRDLVDLRPLIETVADLLSPRALEHGVRMELTLDAIAAPIPGSSEELTQLFQNLIENAIKYGRKGTAVRVEAVPVDDAISISVIDAGEGIAREHLPRLTERFYRIDTARSRELGGTGLGLAIVKHIVNRHRGELKIRSEPGVGSTFEVMLPTALPARPAVSVKRTTTGGAEAKRG